MRLSWSSFAWCYNRHCLKLWQAALSCCFTPSYYANEPQALCLVRTMKEGTEGGIIWVILSFQGLSPLFRARHSLALPEGSLYSKVGHPRALVQSDLLDRSPGGCPNVQLDHSEFYWNWHKWHQESCIIQLADVQHMTVCGYDFSRWHKRWWKENTDWDH